MKTAKLFLIFVFALFLYSGCSDNNSIVNPTESVVSQSSDNVTGQILKSSHSRFGHLEDDVIVDGKKGGTISIKQKLPGFGKEYDASVKCKIKIPKGAFEGKIVFNIDFDLEGYGINLYPSPYQFNKPLIMTLQYKGVDASKFDPATTKFKYIADDGTEYDTKNKGVFVNPKENILMVKEVELPHFSRWAWAK